MRSRLPNVLSLLVAAFLLPIFSAAAAKTKPVHLYIKVIEDASGVFLNKYLSRNATVLGEGVVHYAQLADRKTVFTLHPDGTLSQFQTPNSNTAAVFYDEEKPHYRNGNIYFPAGNNTFNKYQRIEFTVAKGKNVKEREVTGKVGPFKYWIACAINTDADGNYSPLAIFPKYALNRTSCPTLKLGAIVL